MHLRTWHHQITTIMQPFHCDLQLQIQDAKKYAHRNNRSLQNTEEEPIDLETIQTAQCVLQHDVANLHLFTHIASPDDNNHAAIPIWSATTESRNAWKYARRNDCWVQNTEEEPIDLETIQDACGLATSCCKTHCNGCMNVARALFWGGSRSTNHETLCFSV